MKYLFIIIVFLLSLGTALANAPAGNGAIKGKVTDGTDGSALIGVNVYFPDLKR
jgi:iron complex outermembrane receptor protein